MILKVDLYQLGNKVKNRPRHYTPEVGLRLKRTNSN